VWRLAEAGDGNRDVWVRRTAALDTAALPPLRACLARPDAHACANARLALVVLVKQWGDHDPRTAELVDQLTDAFVSLSVPGQTEVLELEATLLRRSNGGDVSADLVPPCARLLAKAAQSSDAGVHIRGLRLAEFLLTRSRRNESASACRELVQACLRDEQASNKLQGIRLGLRPDVNAVELIVPLLNDPAPEVRQAAMLAVGDAPSVISTDDLLQWLHDPDPDVRRLCEEALLWSRHLPQKYLKLGRLLTDTRAEVRLQVLDCLRRDPDLEPGIWLRRMSHDPAAAVRAAAARVAAADGISALGDRVAQMAESDPSPTVRQLARYYGARIPASPGMSR
jgi:HEAT repeat protein